VVLNLSKLGFTDVAVTKQRDSSARAERLIVETERRCLDTMSE